MAAIRLFQMGLTLFNMSIDTLDTNRRLMSYHREIISWRQNDSVRVRMDDFKINAFYRYNTNKINSLIAEIKLLNEKYFVTGIDGKMKFEDKKPVVKEGLAIENYNTEYNLLMDTPVTIRF